MKVSTLAASSQRVPKKRRLPFSQNQRNGWSRLRRHDMNSNLVQRRTVGTPEEITIAPVISEKAAGEESPHPSNAPAGAVIAIRRGPIDENGAHFATAGNSTYFDRSE